MMPQCDARLLRHFETIERCHYHPKWEAEGKGCGAETQKAQTPRERQDAERATLAPRINPSILRMLDKRESASVLLLGPTGVGKTSGAKWLLAGRKHKFIKCDALSRAEREYPLGSGSPPLVDTARSARLLILDDVGTDLQHGVATLQSVIDHRYDKRLPTIVTTGLTLDELRSHIGAPYLRRITEQFTRHKVLIVDCHRVERASP